MAKTHCALRALGLALGVVIFTLTSVTVNILNYLARLVVTGIEGITGAEIEQDNIQWNGQRIFNKPEYEEDKKGTIVDEEESLRKSQFPFTPDQLIAKAKTLVSKEVAYGSKKPDLLAEDFQFIFPIIGPLTKAEYCSIYGSFKVDEAFQTDSNFFGFTVDPTEPNRVWLFTRPELKHKGTFKLGRHVFPATNKTVIHTPQVMSFSFDKDGRVFKMTGGYAVDKTIGNAGGLGGMFGVVHAIGGSGSLPGPETKPWRPSLEWEAWGRRVPQIIKEWQKFKQ